MYDVAFFLVQDHDVAEDVVHAVFLRCLRRMPSLAFAEFGRPYLLRAARNEALEKLRGRVRNRQLLSSAYGCVADPPACAEETLLQGELQRSLRRIIDALPTRCKAAVLLRLDQELSHPEIAAQLEVSVKAVEKQMARARRLLQAHFTPSAND
jgi:RNA polymerase sigma factor (sigma-70 family)